MPDKINKNKNNYKTRKTKNNKKTRKFQKGGAQASASARKQVNALPLTPPEKLKQAIKLANDRDFSSANQILMNTFGDDINKFLKENNIDAQNYYMMIGYLKHNELKKSNNANSGTYESVGNSSSKNYADPTYVEFNPAASSPRMYIPYKPGLTSTSTPTYNIPTSLPHAQTKTFNKSNPFAKN